MNLVKLVTRTIEAKQMLALLERDAKRPFPPMVRVAIRLMVRQLKGDIAAMEKRMVVSSRAE